ncbi:adenosylcobinamide-phosphate synthase CbiB [Propionivibrio limicola]|uniref:adenosylcobinamide-phosphate synthase CbiB n=1 Tax=Propionivibrio limicola TaxID=167645 RepID=UPI001292324B|nr:adenosylcobinamide-phosphate synthase CbiB [Propionivibrio limicola]
MPVPFAPDPFAFDLPPALWLPLAALAGVLLDRVFGEVRRFHPLVGFGTLANRIERLFNRGQQRRVNGLIAWSLAVLPWTALAFLMKRGDYLGWVFEAFLLYFALGGRSLTEHAERVGADLSAGNLPAAREHVGWIVSRNTADLDESGVAKACVESTLENGNDAVFGALFWFMLFGGAGAVLFRLANTLDAMWGYKTERFLRFGWAAARIDDLLNFLPARLTAFSYALLGQTRRALACWRRQAPVWESPNAGPVMSSGAGSLGLALGGPAFYHGQLEERPVLGEGRPARGEDIPRALTLVRRSLALWLLLYLMLGVSLA